MKYDYSLSNFFESVTSQHNAKVFPWPNSLENLPATDWQFSRFTSHNATYLMKYNTVKILVLYLID